MIKLELPEATVAIVLEGLAAMPLHRAFDAFVSIRSQMAAQQQVSVQPPAAPPPEPPAAPPAEPPKPNGAMSS